MRNVAWLIAIVVVGAIAWALGGWLIGLIAAVIVLIVSETVERVARRRRVAAQGGTVPSVRRAISSSRDRPKR